MGCRVRRLGCIDIYWRAALRAKIRPDAGPLRTGLRPQGGDEAEAEGCGGSTVEADNEVWPDLRRNPKGRGHFSPFLRQSSLADTRYASLLIPRTEKKWLPSLHVSICRYTLRGSPGAVPVVDASGAGQDAMRQAALRPC